MPRSAFPLSRSKNRSYKLGNRCWRVVTFDALGLSCRLLINYNYELQQFQALLGFEEGGDTKVMARYERHPTHDGWHAHVACESDDMPSGIKVGPWVMRMKGGKHKRFRAPCPQTDDEAYKLVVDFFRLDRLAGEGGFI